jgi:hypothetical protein
VTIEEVPQAEIERADDLLASADRCVARSRPELSGPHQAHPWRRQRRLAQFGAENPQGGVGPR